MNMQRSRMLRQSMAEEQRKLEAARQAFVVSPCADENESASFYEAADNCILFMQRAGQRLRHLEQSLAVIEHRLHCLCADCGEDIPARRLAAQPEAMRCAECQADWEEEYRRLHPAPGADRYERYLYSAQE